MKNSMTYTHIFICPYSFEGDWIVLLIMIVFNPVPGTAAEEVMVTKSGLQYVDRVVGSEGGSSGGRNRHSPFSGKLTDGTQVDNSKDRKEPFSFRLRKPAPLLEGGTRRSKE